MKHYWTFSGIVISVPGFSDPIVLAVLLGALVAGALIGYAVWAGVAGQWRF